MRKTILLSSVLAVLAAMMCFARPIRGASAASSEEFPASDLPYDAEVEWLMSDGASYINLGFYPEFGFVYDFDITPRQSMWGYIFGAYYPPYGLGISQTRGGDWVLYHARGTQQVRLDISVGERHSFVFSPEGLIVDSTERDGLFDAGSIPRNLYLFARNATSSGNPDMFARNVELHFFRIYKAGIVVCDLIPVRVGETGCMYDRVSGELFRNAGTGSFVIGPDLNP